MPESDPKRASRAELMFGVRIELDVFVVVIKPLVHLTGNQERGVLTTHLAFTDSFLPVPKTDGLLGFAGLLLEVFGDLADGEDVPAIRGNVQRLCSIGVWAREVINLNLLMRLTRRWSSLGFPPWHSRRPTLSLDLCQL